MHSNSNAYINKAGLAGLLEGTLQLSLPARREGVIDARHEIFLSNMTMSCQLSKYTS